MSWMMSHPIISLSYAFLYLSVLLLWMPENWKIVAWGSALFISISLGLMSHQLEMIAIIPVILLALAAYYSQKEKTPIVIRVIGGMLVFVLGIGLMMHQFPGFHNLIALDHVYISHDAIPFTLYLNFDKTIMGIFILGFYHLISSKKEWSQLLKQVAMKAPLVIIVVVVAALSTGFVKFDPKIPHSILLWSVTNLLWVCMAEEAFFRGFIQKNLSLMMKQKKYGNYVALLIAAILFGLAHYAGGTQYVMLATLAGLGYGWIYMTTQRIEGSILTHFALNLIHFLLFTYPALAIV